MSFRDPKGIRVAIEDCVSPLHLFEMSLSRLQAQVIARKWITGHGFQESLGGVLEELDRAVAAQQKLLKKECTVFPILPPAEGDLEPATPDPPTWPGRGFEYEGVGADLVLEMCWRQLSSYDEETRATAKTFMQQTKEAAHTSTQSIVEEVL